MAAYRRPESVLVVVHSGRSVLVMLRVQPFNFWQSVTGSLEAGEQPADTAVRELAEETGLRVPGWIEPTGIVREFEIDPRWRKRYAPGVTVNREHEFRLALPGTPGIRLDAHEHSAYKWLDIDEAIETVWSFTNREALEALRSEL